MKKVPYVTVLSLQFLLSVFPRLNELPHCITVLSLQFLLSVFPRLNELPHCITVLSLQFLLLGFLRLNELSLHHLPLSPVSCLQFLVLSLQFLPLGFPRLNELSPCITVLCLRFLILISERIKYKVACMCFSAVGGSGLAYLSELLHVYTPSRTLCSSSDTHILEIQQYKRKTHGFRTFSCFAPTFGIHSHKTLDTAQPCHLLKPN